jgi:CheY-like chemotaxis protein
METKKRFSVMVVDDDQVSAFLTTCILEESDVFERPLVFHQVDGALQYIQRNCLSVLPLDRLPLPQVLLLDVNMPNRDGFDLAVALLNICPDYMERTLLCILTFSDHYRDKKKAQEMGIDCYFVQPLKDVHIQRIREVVNKKGLLIG